METKPMSFNLINFEKWLRWQIEMQNITVTKLSKISGVHANTIYNYLARRCEPTLYNTLLLVRALGYELEAVKR